MQGDVFIEENGFYQIDFTKATWAEGTLNKIYSTAKVALSDVDWIAELNDHIVFVQYKNSNIPGASDPNSFNPASDESLNRIAKKYFDSLHFLKAMRKTKTVRYVYIVEAPIISSTERLQIRNKLQSKLPFKLQEGMRNELINQLLVLSIEEWNQHADYSAHPLTPYNQVLPNQ